MMKLLERSCNAVATSQKPFSFAARRQKCSYSVERTSQHAPQKNTYLHGRSNILGDRMIARAGDDNEELPWERKERMQNLVDQEGKDLPFPVYLLGSAIVAIAAVGSIFEIINRNAIFGVLPPESPFWLPILGFFGVTGIPSAGFLLFKAINAANADADRQDKADGY